MQILPKVRHTATRPMPFVNKIHSRFERNYYNINVLDRDKREFNKIEFFFAEQLAYTKIFQLG